MYRNYIDLIQRKVMESSGKKMGEQGVQPHKVKMESEVVVVNNVPIKVDSWGGYLPSKILEGTQDKPEELILMIPGNPGVTQFYEKFLSCLYEKSKKPIWILSHGGHDEVKRKYPSLRKNKHLYTLQGQIDQKNGFIETYLKGVSLHCIAHSIGCKMLLELLKNEKDSEVRIDKCLMLFPTLERMAETPNGATVTFIINYILSLVLFGSWIFVYLPKFLQIVLLRAYCFVTRVPPHNMRAMLKLVNPHVLNNVFYLARDEMKNVKELDHEAIKLHADKLKLFYGASDGWTPLKYYTELKEKHKNVDAEVCAFQHTFVLKEWKEVADLAYKWLIA